MSDERLAQIQRLRSAMDGPVGLDARWALDELLAEIERLRGESAADTEAVRGALVAVDVLRVALPGPAARRMAKLHARFADRIAAYDARAEAD